MFWHIYIIKDQHAENINKTTFSDSELSNESSVEFTSLVLTIHYTWHGIPRVKKRHYTTWSVDY